MEKKTIIIVEDEIITAMDIQMQLELSGYMVQVASSGEEAIEMAVRLRPDLILMDIVLKGEMDGTQAAQCISDLYKIPIVFLSAFNDDYTFKRAKLSDPYGYLTKPFETRDLHRAVELALYKHQNITNILAADKRYRAIMDNASCGLFVHDERGIISEANKQCEQIFNVSKDKLIGCDFKSFFIPSEIDYITVQLQKMVEEKNIGPNQAHIQSSESNVKEVQFSSSCIDIDTENLYLTVINDETARNRLQ